MTRRQPEPQWRYLLNTDPDHLEVHDLDNEKPQCQIDEIIRASNAQYLRVSTEAEMAAWLREHPEYDGCYWCLRAYHRK